MFFNKRIKNVIQEERITGVVLQQEAENRYLFTLEEIRKQYSNYYLWKYVLRDVLISLLSGFTVCFYTKDRESGADLKDDFEVHYSCYQRKDGTTLIFCSEMNRHILTILLEEYNALWEYGDPICFLACDESKEISQAEQVEPLGSDTYCMRIVALPDGMGVEIELAAGMTENELLARMKRVLEQYKLELLLKK